MKRHTFGQWMIAVRPWSFPASAMPVIVTVCYLFWKGAEINWLFALWALINIVIFHAAGNTWSDYFDYKKHVDREDTFGAKTLTGGMFTPSEILWLSITLTAVGTAGGLTFVTLTGFPLLWIGLAGVVCTLLYPFMKYNALGDVIILLTYALLPTVGVSFIVTGAIDWNVLWIALPVGLITDGILHSNNTRDMVHDSRAHISTFAMIIGRKASAYLYGFEMIFPFIWIGGLSIIGKLPLMTIIIFLTLPVAIACTRTMLNSIEGGPGVIADLDVRTANLQLMFSALLSLSFVNAYFL